jgi:hypothetical protein
VRNRLILCVGFRGSGKSTVAASILRKNVGTFVFDPHFDGAYSWIPNTARTCDELADYRRWFVQSVRAGRDIPKQCGLRYVPDGRLDPFEALNNFCVEVWPWRNVWMCVEEVSESTRSASASGMPPELRRIVNQGRHKGLNQIYCGLRYAEIPRSISAGADVSILFRSQEPLDLDAMRTRIGSDAVERVQALGPHEALVFFPDRTWQIIGSRDKGIAELVLRDTAENVQTDIQQESA